MWLDGRLAPATEVGFSPLDRGLLLGDGVFETMRAYAGRPFAFAEHVARLRESARLTGLAVPDVDLAEVIARVLDANGLAERDAAVRVTLTAGVGGAGVSRRGAGPPSLLVTAAPVAYDARVYEEGVSVIVSTRTRHVPAEVLDPRIKSLNYLPHVLARTEAEGRGAFDAVLLTLDGHVAEATTANVFARVDDALVTPHLDVGILDGITRRTLLELAAAQGFRVKERADVTPRDLARADELFLTASVAEVLPVTRFEDMPVGAGVPGEWTRTLSRAYREHARREAGAPSRA